MNILVNGGCGYIGGALCPFLEAAGHKVSRCDVCLFGGDGEGVIRCQYQSLGVRRMKEMGVEAIVHLAGYPSVPACEADPRRAYRHNVAGFLDLVLKARSVGCCLVYASSVSVYGFAADSREADCLPNPRCHYDMQKQVIDHIAAVFGRETYGLRFGTVCGPSPNLRSDLLLNSMVRSAVLDGKVMLANPNVRRPILGINDLCRAVCVLLAERPEPGVYNLATENVRMEDVAEQVASRLAVPVERAEMRNAYDLTVATEKAEKANIRFTDDIPNLIDGIVGLPLSSRVGRRDKIDWRGFHRA